MIDLVKEKKKVELSRMSHGIMENELKILERLDDIERIKKSIEDQKGRIKELKSEFGDDN